MRIRTLLASALAGSALAAFAPPVHAAPILSGPAAGSEAAALGALADGYQRQQDVFATLENGLSLDVLMKPAEVDLVRSFFAQTSEPDFATFASKHPFDVVAEFGEHGDEGNFAGIASVGVAARLIVLRGDPTTPAPLLDAARASAVRAAKAWHVFGSIGGPGVVARGVRRRVAEQAGAPALPGTPPATLPLADGSGAPLPASKSPAWREPVAAGYGDWMWIDDTSKDQVSGYALAVAWLYDALRDDAAVPRSVTDDLAADMLGFAKSLMQVAPELGIDLCVRDADGRLTSFHDLNPRQIDPQSVIPENIALRNGFNAALAMGIMRAAYHVTGDADVGKFFYEQMVDARDFPSDVLSTAAAIYMGPSTNYSNVNMLAIGLATLGRVETDPYVRGKLQDAVERAFFDTGSDRDPKAVGQAWFDAVYGAYAKSPSSTIRERVASNLGGFQTPPAFQRERLNCDDAEIDAGVCVGVDGVTQITLVGYAGHNGGLVAKDVVPMSIRPDSDFEWRSDPHRVNGYGSSLLDPGGDFLAAYWLARLSDLDDTSKNVSPIARPALPHARGDAGADADVAADAESDASLDAGADGSVPSDASDGGAAQAEEPAASGSGCATSGSRGPASSFAGVAMIASLAAGVRRRRRGDATRGAGARPQAATKR